MLAGRPWNHDVFRETLALERDPEWRTRIEKLTENCCKTRIFARKPAQTAPAKSPLGLRKPVVAIDCNPWKERTL